MNFKALAAFGTLVFAGQAFALAPPATEPTNIVFMSGSSALNTDIQFEITTNICTGSADVYSDSNSTAGGGDQTAIYCTSNIGGTGVPTLIVYRKNGGSIFGVYPVGTTAIHRYVFNSTTCPGLAASGKCTGWTGASNQTTTIPEVGVSDEEPGLFSGINLPSPSTCVNTTFSDPCPTTGNNFNSVPAVVQAMGIAVNPALATAITGAVGSNNLSWDWIATAFARNSAVYKANAGNGDWSGLSALMGGTAFSGTVQICKRAAGSGTQAAFNAFFMNQPCSAGFLTPSDISDNNPGFYQVTEGTSSGAVKTCLNGAGTVKAIGILSLDQQPGGSDTYSFISIDGVAPTDANVTTGKYKYWVESTVQTAKNASGASAQFATALVTQLKTVFPANPNGVYNLAGSTVVPATKTMLGTHGGNTCRPELF